MSFILTLAKWTSPNFFRLARDTKTLQVISIPYSPYTELALWALQLSKIPFQEHGYVPVQHILPALAARLCGPAKYLPKSSRILQPGEDMNKVSGHEDAKRRSTVLPIGIQPNGDVLVDSWEIAKVSTLKPLNEELRQLLDHELGPLGRQYIYSYILHPRNAESFNELWTFNGGWFWRFLWNYCGFRKTVHEKMGSIFRSNDAAAVTQCKEKLHKVWSALDEIVQKRPGKYLMGDEISTADIAVASMAALVILPPLYCDGRYHKIFQRLLDQDPLMKKEVDELRNSPLGQYALSLYASHRLPKE